MAITRTCISIKNYVDELKLNVYLLIPMKVVSDSDLIPVTRSDAIPVVFGAKRRWRSYSA